MTIAITEKFCSCCEQFKGIQWFKCKLRKRFDRDTFERAYSPRCRACEAKLKAKRGEFEYGRTRPRQLISDGRLAEMYGRIGWYGRSAKATAA